MKVHKIAFTKRLGLREVTCHWCIILMKRASEINFAMAYSLGKYDCLFFGFKLCFFKRMVAASLAIFIASSEKIVKKEAPSKKVNHGASFKSYEESSVVQKDSKKKPGKSVLQ